MCQIVLQHHHLLIELGCCAAQRHTGVYGQYLLLLLLVGKGPVGKRATERAQCASQAETEPRLDVPLVVLAAYYLIISRLIPRTVVSIDVPFRAGQFAQVLRQTVDGQTKEQDDCRQDAPSVPLCKSHVSHIPAAPGAGQTHVSHLSLLPTVVAHALYESRDKEVGHQQSHCEIDDDDPCKVIQIVLQEIGQPQNYHQRTYCGEQRSQDGHESLAVVVIAVVIYHHHRSIYHHAQRYGDACQ